MYYSFVYAHQGTYSNLLIFVSINYLKQFHKITDFIISQIIKIYNKCCLFKVL